MGIELLLCADYTIKKGRKKPQEAIAIFLPQLISILPFFLLKIARTSWFNYLIETTSKKNKQSAHF
ncbi:hypothetical protein [Photobacterium chitinilyticum]|uniref:hypothetical protein n=1 Tax=Photobacterium chitinilyticum TaxID=2485123 RepID=UPI0013E8CA98|nr:hypothetical protein [Photobacterium chitinilyticum]